MNHEKGGKNSEQYRNILAVEMSRGARLSKTVNKCYTRAKYSFLLKLLWKWK